MHETCQEDACYARGILTRDNEWEYCFRDASAFQTGWYLPQLFVSALLYIPLSKDIASNVWHLFADDMSDDLPRYIRHHHLAHDNDPALETPHHVLALFQIAQGLLRDGKTLAAAGVIGCE